MTYERNYQRLSVVCERLTTVPLIEPISIDAVAQQSEIKPSSPTGTFQYWSVRVDDCVGIERLTLSMRTIHENIRGSETKTNS
jgi:hypothetical protein